MHSKIRISIAFVALWSQMSLEQGIRRGLEQLSLQFWFFQPPSFWLPALLFSFVEVFWDMHLVGKWKLSMVSKKWSLSFASPSSWTARRVHSQVSYPNLFWFYVCSDLDIYTHTHTLILSYITWLCYSGVARGSGWQHIGAYVNLGSYYLVGIPVALLLGFVLDLKGKGLWSGLVAGATVQSFSLSLITGLTNWEKLVSSSFNYCYQSLLAPLFNVAKYKWDLVSIHLEYVHHLL